MKKKETKIVLIILVTILIFCILSILSKYFILSNLSNKSENIKMNNNYYAEAYTLSDNALTMRITYNKDSKFLTNYQTMSPIDSENRKIISYVNGNEKISTIQYGENKIAILGENCIENKIPINTYNIKDMDFFSKIILTIQTKVRSRNCNGKECYLIEKSKDWKLWVEKDTGLILREINGDIISEFKYDFNTVKDTDIIRPDISNFKLVEKQ